MFYSLGDDLVCYHGGNPAGSQLVGLNNERPRSPAPQLPPGLFDLFTAPPFGGSAPLLVTASPPLLRGPRGVKPNEPAGDVTTPSDAIGWRGFEPVERFQRGSVGSLQDQWGTVSRTSVQDQWGQAET